jgi:predicted GIY-YIG superfamily endonuclease
MFCYVYILQSQANDQRYYVGLADDLRDRLRRHNAGEVLHTAKFRAWRVETAIAFTDRVRAAEFERYLKTALQGGHLPRSGFESSFERSENEDCRAGAAFGA